MYRSDTLNLSPFSIKEKHTIRNIFQTYIQNVHAQYVFLTHISLVSHKRDIGNQCRPRSDAASCLIRVYTVSIQVFLSKSE